MKTLACSGIRVSELKFFTVEAVKDATFEIKNKGKYRTVYLSESLCQYLLKYCEENNITSGFIFTGKDGVNPISPNAVWRKINSLSKKTGIHKKKLHPHSFRHFFGSLFIKIVGDIYVLQGFLGHSKITTTEIYLHSDEDYRRKCINKIIA